MGRQGALAERGDMVLKKFNVNGLCYPDRHYMADLHERLRKIKVLVDQGDYFVINRARQYGKTTTLWALKNYLRETYVVASINFQQLSESDFEEEYAFTSAFADLFLDAIGEDGQDPAVEEPVGLLRRIADGTEEKVGLRRLFKALGRLCANAPKAVVLLVDEVDSASNNQVFLDFLGQLRAGYMKENRRETFWSVALAGVYDIRNLKLKLHPDGRHSYNSPWNVAADFNVDMSLGKEDIAGMLEEYEQDWHTGMDIPLMAGLLYDYTSGYPFLVSRLCKLLDESIPGKDGFPDKASAWSRDGVTEAVKDLLTEPNPLFDDMLKKLKDFTQLRKMLYAILFKGERVLYNIDTPLVQMGNMFGFVENVRGYVGISNRIFEMRLYNLFLSEEMLDSAIYKAADVEKNRFIDGGRLNMELVLERFVEAFTDIYSGVEASFLEENGRRFFLLYLKPIINGVGNYYVEARTRDMRRTDVVIDYRGKRYVCEMKIWHGEEYNKRGERQLLEYLEDYHLTVGYMLSFNFNKNKKAGVKRIQVDEKEIIEAVV